MVLPPPIPPPHPDDRADLDSDDPAIQDLRAHAAFPDLDAARDQQLRSAMSTALAQQQASLKKPDSGRTGKKKPAPRGWLSILLPYAAIAAILFVVAGLTIPAVMSVQGQANRPVATNESMSVALVAPAPGANDPYSGGDSNGWGNGRDKLRLQGQVSATLATTSRLLSKNWALP